MKVLSALVSASALSFCCVSSVLATGGGGGRRHLRSFGRQHRKVLQGQQQQHHSSSPRCFKTANRNKQSWRKIFCDDNPDCSIVDTSSSSSSVAAAASTSSGLVEIWTNSANSQEHIQCVNLGFDFGWKTSGCASTSTNSGGKGSTSNGSTIVLSSKIYGDTSDLLQGGCQKFSTRGCSGSKLDDNDVFGRAIDMDLKCTDYAGLDNDGNATFRRATLTSNLDVHVLVKVRFRLSLAGRTVRAVHFEMKFHLSVKLAPTHSVLC